MRLQLCRTLWGIPQPPSVALPRIKAAGFSVIEGGFHWLGPADDRELREALAVNGMRFLAQTFSLGATVDEHLASLRAQFAQACTYDPVKINVHSGADRWPLADRVRFYRECLAMQRDLPVEVVHETHRGRCFYSPWNTLEVLDAVPDLWFCADFSHWCVVAERLLQDEAEVLARIIPRVRHIHARVGYAQGPQVPDPRAPEWQEAVEAHERWWDAIWSAQEQAGVAVSTLTPEFGPPDYQHTLPYTKQPVADLWDICTWQGQRQAARFAARFTA